MYNYWGGGENIHSPPPPTFHIGGGAPPLLAPPPPAFYASGLKRMLTNSQYTLYFDIGRGGLTPPVPTPMYVSHRDGKWS